MMRSRNLGILCAASLLGACASTPPANFYSLRALESAQPLAGARPELTIGVGPVRFPRFLDHAQIVTRASAHRLALDEFERWGGTLEDDFSRVLSENLSALLGTGRVLVLPSDWRAPLDRRIGAEVLAFEGMPDGQARLKVRWMLQDPNQEGPPLMRVTQYSGALSAPGDTEALITTLSALLAEFSRDVAEAVIGARR
ncbi:MAG: membrane integrity-associated transporter subunit PqiC [Chromatiaceae bacterium]|nr:membrane integrity-associated transporter subunit PqiC [Chromatiaceae bacterium]